MSKKRVTLAAILATFIAILTPVEYVNADQMASPTISAGKYHTCAVTTSGAIRCWGSNFYGQTDVPSDLGQVTQVSAGDFDTCAVTILKLVRCWGGNDTGQMDVPSDLGQVTQVSVGTSHTCAITVSSLVRCWGGATYIKDVPSNVGQVRSLAAGHHHVCTVSFSGVAQCWGDNGFGQNDVPQDLGQISQISAGQSHTCAVNLAGAVICWGGFDFGATDVPSDLGEVAHLSGTPTRTCVVTVAGVARCWGTNSFGQNDVPSDLGQVTQITTGFQHTCVITKLNISRCWGNNNLGQSYIPQGFLSLPGQPVLSVFSSTSTAIELTWTAPDYGVPTDYVVEYSSDKGKSWNIFNDGVHRSLTTEVKGLRNGTSYLLRVAASSPIGQGPFSAVVSQKTKALAVQVKGDLKSGGTARALLVNIIPGSKTTFQWLLDGKKISGKTSATLKILKTYVGRKISVNAVCTAKGFAGITVRSSAVKLLK